MILVTGGGGFVGRQVVRSIVEEGYSIRVVLRSGDPAISILGKVADIVETVDLFRADGEWIRGVLDGIDTVVHVAWYARPTEYLWSEINLDCLEGTIKLARACSDAGVRRFVGVGTCFEYDLDVGILKTDTPLKPRTLYAACKASAYQVLSQLLPKGGVEFAWCRLFYLYGEGEDRRRLVPYLRQRLAAGKKAELTSGHQIRDFLDVREAGALITRIALGTRQGPINVCSGTPITVRQLAERIADEFGRRDLLQFGARPDNPIDPPCVVGVR